MGLLDDAIREHLELKRRRGADPAEVAREQHEALDPPSDRRRSAELDAVAEAGEAGTPQDEGALSGSEPARLEETAELDMKAVLEDEEPPATEEGVLEWGSNEAAAPEQSPTAGAPWHAHESESYSSLDDVAHDAPDIAGPLPGQEHLQFEHDPAADSQPEK